MNTCRGAPVLTHYRVTQRTVSDTTTNAAYSYTYAYEGAAVNDTTHSNYAALAFNLRSGASNPYSEFRGHSKVTVTAPDGLRTESYFYQDDVNKGRASEVRQYNGNYLLTRSLTHWVGPALEISNGQVSGICTKKSSSDPCYQDQKIIWSYSDWNEACQYGANVTDVNSTLYTGVKKLYQYDTTPPYGYGNLKSVTEQIWSGSAWVSYRLTRTGYATNVSDGGTNPNATLYLVGLPGSTQAYQCVNGTCSESLADLVQYSCNLYDNPVSGGSGLCALYQNGANKVETLDTPDSGLLTGTRTLLHFGDGVNADYTGPHYRDVQYRYNAKGNRIRTTQYTGEGTKTALATTGAQVSEACYGVADQLSGCVDDGYYAYPRWERNALQQVTSWTIDYDQGVPATETDPNGAVTSAGYDAFGRMIALVRPGDRSAAPTVSAIYHDGTPAWVEVMPKVGAVSRKFYNGLGQLTQTQQVGATLNDPACSGTCTVVTDQKTEYVNGVKRTVKTAPYAVTVSGYAPQTWANATVTTYDVLGRPVTISAPDQTASSFSYSLDGNRQKTTATDAENHSTYTWKDALGRTVKVQPATGPWLTYEYDATDRLTVVKQFQTNNVLFATTTISYDVAGRKTQMVDPDMGTWVYSYDAVGNLVTQRDAKLQTLWFGYDLLNRLLEKRASNANGTLLASYGYDEGENGIGRRSWMNAGDGSAQTAWSYDARGRVTQQTDVITGVGAYGTSWSYDSADRVTSMTYPSGEMVNYTYLPQGAVSQVTSSQAAYLSGAGYDASGRAIERLLGNGVKNTWSYNAWTEANKGGRLSTAQAYKTTAPTPRIQDLSYTGYDKVGNLTALSDYAAGESLTFTYDALNRLDAVSGAYTDNPEYDPRGNLSQKTGLNGTTVSLSYPTGTAPARPHAALSAGSNTFQYDANGSMTQRTLGTVTYTLTYDIENRLTGISGGGLSASYTYNADGARIKAVVTSGGVTRTTGYVGDYFEISLGQPRASAPGGTLPNCALPRRCVFFPMVNSGLILSPGQAWYSYYYAGASRIALRIKSNQLNLDDGVFYFLSDHLGGTALTLDTNGAKTAELRYTAWGETRVSTGTTPTQRRYTGQLQAEAGLYFYNARWYDAALGRFAQADTMVPVASQGTQAWDRYAYVNNNAVNHNDPTGHCLWDGCVFEAMLVGAVISVAVDAFVTTQIEHKEYTWQRGLVAAGFGALSGGIGAAVIAPAAVAAGSTTASALSGLVYGQTSRAAIAMGTEFVVGAALAADANFIISSAQRTANQALDGEAVSFDTHISNVRENAVPDMIWGAIGYLGGTAISKGINSVYKIRPPNGIIPGWNSNPTQRLAIGSFQAVGQTLSNSTLLNFIFQPTQPQSNQSSYEEQLTQ